MTITVDRLFEDAQCLSGESRVALAERLIESAPPDESLFAAQLLVAQRRADELDSGTVKGIPGEEALSRVRNSIAMRSQA